MRCVGGLELIVLVWLILALLSLLLLGFVDPAQFVFFSLFGLSAHKFLPVHFFEDPQVRASIERAGDGRPDPDAEVAHVVGVDQHTRQGDTQDPVSEESDDRADLLLSAGPHG